jgi:phospholipid/cholesterol/gamma-HCH transport system permease protein
MLPILVSFADMIGTVGGYLVATLYADINSFTFLNSVKVFADVNDVIGGLIKSMFFGAIIAIIGATRD